MRWWYAGLVAVSKRRVTFHVFYVFVCDDERTVARHELFSLQSRRGGGTEADVTAGSYRRGMDPTCMLLTSSWKV